MGNYFVKMPTLPELTQAKPTSINPQIPEPTTFFNFPLRTVILVTLACYTIMGIVGLAQSVAFLYNPIFWVFLVFDLIGLSADILGFWGVYRLIPEWMIAYGWSLILFLAIDVIRCVAWAILGNFVGAIITLALKTIAELRDAKPAPSNPAIPEPTTYFNLPLKAVLMVILAVYAVLGIVSLAGAFGLILNPIFWIYIVFDLLGLALDAFGFFAVWRVVPEWMAAYGWALVVLFLVHVVQFITLIFVGGLVSGLITLCFHALFTFAMISCLMALRAYAFACRGIV
ncbi:UNVERIFIED_CONTAM: hypothetical protein HDU68_007396 [Siphonaria sp. JEL0065]|nr:hypothetical protein HDU68_007396 [Siphonaria sp. JEL0065]